MTCNILVIFTNDSEKLAKDLIHHFGKASINAICLDNHAYHLSSIWHGTKSKIRVIFLSPGFLRYLETNTLDAYYICSRLEASSTVAVFCGGLTERHVLCYHMAPLKSFNNWCKFEMLERDSEREDGRFPEGLIKRIRDVVKQDDREPIDIVIVPQVLNRQNNAIYLIFSKFTPDSISIHLHDPSEVEIKHEKMNPYVLKCLLPDSVFQFSHNISISVRDKDGILVKQLLHVSQIGEDTTPTSNTHQPMTRKEQFVDAQLAFLSSFSGIQSEEKAPKTITGSSEYYNIIQDSNTNDARHDDIDPSLRHFCRQYGFDEVNLLISNENTCTIDLKENLTMSFDEIHEEIDQNVSLRRGSICKLPEMDAFNRMDSYLIEETDILRLRCSSRSLSLPPTLVPGFRNSDPHYLNMGGPKNQDIKPHEQLLLDMQNLYMENVLSQDDKPDKPDRPGSRKLSSERYVSFTLGEKVPGNLRSLLKKGLSTSQQELLDLMQDFKEGECSMSNVEQQFQLWTEKHCAGKQAPDTRTTYEKARKTSAFALPWKKKRFTKNSNQMKDYTKTSADKQEDQKSSRKISNTSASSASSKTSESSAKTMSPRDDLNRNDRNSIDPTTTFTGWVSTYSPTSSRAFCPLYPEKNPPPPPNRPPPPPNRPPPLAPRGIKPSNLKRTNQPAKEQTKFSPNRYDRGVVYELKQEGKEPEYVNYSTIAQMTGLDDDGDCFAPENTPIESTSAVKEISRNEKSSKEIPINPYNQDIDGYECPIKPAQQTGEEIPEIRIFRRSASLPSNLNKSGDFSDILLVDHSETHHENAENTQNIDSCEQCCSMVESFKSNVYMSLLELQRNSHLDRNVRQPMSRGVLSDSQQELLELLYAFKRGEKTMSQVERQFQVWHSKHIGVPPGFLFGSSQEKCKHEKQRKQAVFGLPGLKNLILGKPKKKISGDIRSPDIELEMLNRNKKISESSNSSQKRFSKTSSTSISSGTSETNEISKSHKVNRKNSGANPGGPSVGPPIPKRPPPMPPVKSIESKTKTDLPTDVIANSPKPVPPPKPKFLFRQTSLDFTDAIVPVGNNAAADAEAPSEKSPTENNEDIARPYSSNYVTPNVHKAPRSGPKKSPNSKISRNPKLPSKAPETLPTKTCNSPNRTAQETPPKKESATKPPNLPPQTMELLKMANLLSLDEEVMSKFYIRRSKSFPNLGASQLQNPPIYLQLLKSVEANLQKSNHVLDVNKFDNKLYFHRFDKKF